MRGVAVVCVVVAGGCHLAFPIDKQKTDAGSTDSGSVDSPIFTQPPRAFSSPSPVDTIYAGYAAPLEVTLAADDPAARIYYTVDDSVPTMSSPNGLTPLTVTIATTTTLRFFADNAAGRSATTLETFIIATAAQSQAGSIVTGTVLAGNTPVVFATPGQVFNGTTNVRTWVHTGCPACQQQLVYGIALLDQGCIVNVGPGLYPGVFLSNRSFAVTAPMEPGTYEVRAGNIQELDCNGALTSVDLPTRPFVRIGVIIVR